MFLTHKQQIREVDWGANHLWDARFVGDTVPPSPFDDWFPAVSISINLFTLENYQAQFYLSTYSLPQNSQEFTIDLTYQDDQNRTLKRWMRDWVNKSILSADGQGRLATLESSVRLLQTVLMKYENGEKVPVEDMVSYWVFPSGSDNYEGGPTAEPEQSTLNLIIAGEGRAPAPR